LGDDEVPSEFRPKIASLQNFVTFEDEKTFSWSTGTNSYRMAFFERSLNHRKRTTLLDSF
jgi:hypothetical protein